jgi:hypothetical protein
MAGTIDPGLVRDLQDAKGALARHGVVIIRAIETDLEPAMMIEAKSSIASASDRLKGLDEDELDRLIGELHKISTDSVDELSKLYVRLLAKLGEAEIGELAKDLEGIGQLFTWDRIARSAAPLNSRLEEAGFPPIDLKGPENISGGFAVELDERWPHAFARFKSLIEEAARQLNAAEVRVPSAGPTKHDAASGNG